MRPTQHLSNNAVLRAPVGATREECGPLAVTHVKYENGARGVESYWQPSDAERAAIADGALIRFSAMGETHPPIWVGVDGLDE